MVLTLLADAGAACLDYQDRALRNLPCTRPQCDEIWTFCHAKERNVPDDFNGRFGYGDVWTWTAIDADTKLVPSFMVGNRNADTANTFMRDLASRLAGRVQLPTNGLKPYWKRSRARSARISTTPCRSSCMARTRRTSGATAPRRASASIPSYITNTPDAAHISTSYVERQNLTMRMQIRRFTRLTNAFSKKVENLEHAIALHVMHYNFARPYKTLTKLNLARPTPAMAVGVADHVWSIEEIVGLIEAHERHDFN